MKHSYNNNVVDFRYHVIVTLDVQSLREYLLTVYEEADLSELESLSDAMAVQFSELEIDWAVKVYNRHMVNLFKQDITGSTWSSMARKDYATELETMEELTFAIYSDCRDELNECINRLEKHCKWNHINGTISDIVFHTRPIEWGERDF